VCASFPFPDEKDASNVLESAVRPIGPVARDTYKLFIQEDMLALDRKDTPTSLRLALLAAA